ncbi:sec-independent protein translocase protein TatA [Nocardioides massiliensis]|uniref:Sec-independent protein translocase protein TatA n=2 Tax=Nocardioides massiliensis TaxID=1325935 RepID=A0ABT9NRG3_9ACTN|nr:Sec-independent protein translocase subunit TatA [Nocardioides massiliensis]MDP9823016.1 sec-independent protein translocase protein TatA [Nocardioides massiliensis]
MFIPQVMGLGPGEIAIIVGVLVLLFGAKKLPELARGSGRALRIFKAETKGLMTDDDDEPKDTRNRTLDAPEAPEADAHPSATSERNPDRDR